MNTPQLHRRVRELLDQVKSPRITRALVDSFLNVANRRYYNFGVDEFQFKQYLRDEMKAFVVNSAPLTAVSDVFTYPADYEHEVGLYVMINGVRRMSQSIEYNEKDALYENAFTEPSATRPYHIESAAGVTMYYGTGNTLGQGFLSYLTVPLDLSWSSVAISSGLNVLVLGKSYYVATAPVTSAAVTYVVGDVFTAASTAFTGGGTVNAVQNPQLGVSCHEELCKIAASEIAASLGQTVTFQLQALGTKRS